MGNKIKFSPMGNDLFGNPNQQDTNSVLKQKFLFAPFSVLNSREGLWQDRKAAWLGLGIQSEVGRGDNHLKMSDTMFAHGAGLLTAKEYTKDEWEKLIKENKDKRGRAKVFGTAGNIAGEKTGTSIFDPVLCELSYDWFCPPKGQIIDPFCGGSVRGIVAAKTGRKYWGCDLRQEQIDANNAQASKICPENPPAWICGNSEDQMENAPAADFVFSCPPYFDLEVYSDNPKDLSTMTWGGFAQSYKTIIAGACERLKENRFACFVVGDIRDKNGNYRDFVGETIRAFRAAGLHFYNDMILVNAVGTLALRVTRQFDAGRKVGKSHQNVLVFVKGDGKKAAQAIVSPVPSRPNR